MDTTENHDEGPRGDGNEAGELPERCCDLILKSARIGVILLDTTGNVIGSNETAWTILGEQDPARVQGTPSILYQLKRFSKTDDSPREALAWGSSDGTIRHLEVTGEHIGARGEQVIWLRDVTTSVEEGRRQALTERLALLEKMAARLGHKINNHLGSLLAGLQVLEKGTSLSEADRPVVSLLLEQTGALTRAVQEVLESVRSEVATTKPVSGA